MYTLVTGAGAGIGKALAMECASRKMNLLLVSLPGAELDATASEIRSVYNTECHTLGIDLSKPESFCNVYKWVKENNFSINVLINNVGVGSKGNFEHTETLFLERQLQLNVHAVTMLTRLLMDELKANAPSHIMNTSSMGGFYIILRQNGLFSIQSVYIFFQPVAAA